MQTRKLEPRHVLADGILADPLFGEGVMLNLVVLEPGANRVTLDAEDCAGNVRHLTITVYYDAAPPHISITSPASGELITASTLLADGAFSDDVGIDHITVNGVNAILHATTWSAVLTFPLDGPREITAIAVDRAGRQSTITIPVTVDATPPIITASVSPAPTPPVGRVPRRQSPSRAMTTRAASRRVPIPSSSALRRQGA